MKLFQVVLYAVIVVTIAGLASRSPGQQPGSEPAVVQADQPTASPDQPEVATTQSIGGMIVSGGSLNIVFFGILGVFSLWSATVVLERIVNLRRDKLLPESFATALIGAIRDEGSPNDFQTICKQNNNTASRILQSGIVRTGRPLPEVEKAMEDAAAREMAALRAKNRPLNVVGNIAPLVGLLGTVVGMIMAFQISSQEGLGKAEQLAEGIYLALMTTAAGLTIAIPCLLFASWFQSKAERFMCDISDCLSRTMPAFAKLEGQPFKLSVPKTSAPPPPVAEDLTPRERFLREADVEASGA